MSAGFDALAHAELLLEQRQLKDAVLAFHCAEVQGCDADRCAAGRWMAAMLSGDFEAAWRESDNIRHRGAPDPYRFWQGEDMTGKRVIIRCLHGFGDTVQFLRYAPLLKAIASRVIVECAPAMVELVRCMPGIDAVFTWGDDAPATPPAWDVQVEVMELPYIFRSTLTSLPHAGDCLNFPAAMMEEARKATGRDSRLQAGVVWAAGEWNPARSMKLEALRSILDRNNCDFWNLQGSRVRNEWHQLSAGANLRDHPMLDNAGILPLAAFIAQLDLIITVDTLAAHLAGAMNVPCLLMLQHAADWRWMTNRDDSPWYSSLRLLRQTQPGDWETVTEQVGLVLDRWSEANTRSVA